ncbi:MAG: hypothetical protein SNG49_07955 [Rikenellaceae bacterium]
MKKKCAEGEQLKELQYTKTTRPCVIPDSIWDLQPLLAYVADNHSLL